MSRILSELLGANEPLFSFAIKDLEKVTGAQGLDIRLSAEIVGKVQMKIRDLRLDPKDTTGKELYHALLAKVEEHNRSLLRQIGCNETTDKTVLMERMKLAWEGTDTPKTSWVLKKSVARKMLKDMPPKKIMARLGYQSVDSMLKSENLYEIYGALRFAESPLWLKKFNKLYLHLHPSDFESRPIEIVIMDKERWGDIAAPFILKKRHNITHLKELGVILMLPITAELRGIAIFVLPLLYHYLNEIRLYSAFFKLQQVKPDFGAIVVDTLNADPGKHAVIAGQHIHWRVIQRYFGKLEHESHPEIFMPHVQPEDLHWRKAEELLYKIDPELAFWKDYDYVAASGQRPVPFNLTDMAASYVNNLPYGEHAIYHFRESLWNEIFVRYMGQEVLEQQVLRQLDNEMISPEKLFH